MRKVKLFILKLNILYKYALPFLLFLCCYEAKFTMDPFFHKNYLLIDQYQGFGLIVCGMWLYEGVRRGKCMWYFACVFGLIYNCLVNIYFLKHQDLHEDYVFLFKFGGLLISCMFVVACFIYEFINDKK